MTRTRVNYVLIVTAILCAGILSFSSCKKDEDPKTAPVLPPESAFKMNFDDFATADDTLKSALQVDTYSNWGYSFLNVSFWNTVLTVSLAVPVASYAEAFNHEAIYHPDEDNWTWSYNFSIGFVAYEAELTGAIEGTNVNWEMRITKQGEYADFLWYRGKSAIDQSGGYWILSENPANSNDLLRIDWKRYSDGTADIKYTNIKPGANENGSYIWYGTTIDELDRFYQIYHKPVNNHTKIEWSSTLKNGRVMDPLHFNDSAWHCWDLQLKDITCP
jgi:hypothetical protein